MFDTIIHIIFFQDLSALKNFMNQELYAYIDHSAGGLCIIAEREL